MRRYLTAVPTNVLNRLFIQLISALPAGEPIDGALRRELSRDGRWPDDEQVVDGVASLPYYAHGRAHQQRLVLQRLESRLRAEVDVDFDSADLSIEHIMPQTLSAEWKAELSTDGQDAQEIFDRLGHTLGNLTLTAWNSKLSNQLFERKQEILSDSELKLNEPLARATSWGVDEIEARGRALAESATALWSAPIPGVVTPHAGFDWGQVDQAVNALPAGSWTSYGDLAELAGTAAQPTANHVAKDSAIKYAYRVLGGDGSVSFNFQWHDESDTRDPTEVLIGEGIEFDEQAAPARRNASDPPSSRRCSRPSRQRLTISRGLAAVETAGITGSGRTGAVLQPTPCLDACFRRCLPRWSSGTRRMSIRLARGPYATSLAGALGRFGPVAPRRLRATPRCGGSRGLSDVGSGPSGARSMLASTSRSIGGVLNDALEPKSVCGGVGVHWWRAGRVRARSLGRPCHRKLRARGVVGGRWCSDRHSRWRPAAPDGSSQRDARLALDAGRIRPRQGRRAAPRRRLRPHGGRG